MDTEHNFSQGDMDLFDNASQDDVSEEEKDVKSLEGAQEQPEDRRSNKPPREPSPAFKNFFTQWESISGVEEKVRAVLDFMRAALGQAPSPRMRDYWEARRLCLPLFKEAMSAAKRAELWGEYIELSSEARRLKEIASEQASFASEQIDLAISALEKDLENYSALLQTIPFLELPENLEAIAKNKENYNSLQQELHLLNTFASRINSLRKEIIKTEMRARQKSKFFERLSASGDKVFPRRKELIKTISQHFTEDVANFYRENFEEDGKHMPPLFILREEIKALQSLAKSLTLNTHCFTETRLLLSQCWDKVKLMDRDRKKEILQKKQAFKQNVEQVQQKIQALSDFLKSEEFSEPKFHQMSDEILGFMRTVELGRDEVRELKDQLQEVKKPIIDKIRERELEHEQKGKEQERARKGRITALKDQLSQIVEKPEGFSMEEATQLKDQIHSEIEGLQLSKVEKTLFERLLKRLRDILHEKKEQALMNLSADDREAFDQLKNLLLQRKEHRQEIKQQLEEYRKALGGSGFDFEKAMAYREMIEEEKVRLEKANEAIEEIEMKIAEFEERHEE